MQTPLIELGQLGPHLQLPPRAGQGSDFIGGKPGTMDLGTLGSCAQREFGTGFAPARWIFKNWRISGVTSFVPGAPFTPTLSTTNGQNITGSSEGARITAVGNPNLLKDQRNFYQNSNTSAFARTPLGNFGSEGVDNLRGLRVDKWDLAVAKWLPLWSEQRSIQFPAESFNAWNYAEFAGLDTKARVDTAHRHIDPTLGAYNSTRSPPHPTLRQCGSSERSYSTNVKRWPVGAGML